MAFEIPFHLQRSVKPPPTSTILVEKIEEKDKELLIHGIKSTRFFRQRLSDLNQYLEVEVSALTALIYKNSNRFHNDKGFKYVRIVQKSWQKFQQLQLEKVAKSFHESLPLVFDLNSKSKCPGTLYLPTRQMLQFFLVRLRGAFHLLNKLQVLCENAGEHALMRLNLGHFWSIGLVHIAVLARLWTLGQSLLVLITEAFAFLHRITGSLPASSVSWLPEGYTFPEDLFQDLALEDCEALKSKIAKCDACQFPEFVSKSSQENGKHFNDILKKASVNLDSVDFGEVILRKDSEEVTASKVKSELILPSSVLPTQLPCTLKAYQKVLAEMQKLESVDKISKFLVSETQSRKVNRKLSLTKKLDQSDWRSLREEVKKQMANSQNTRNSDNLVQDLKTIVTFWILYPNLKGEKPPNWKHILRTMKCS